MSDVLSEKTITEWAGLHRGRSGLLNEIDETLAELLAHRLRKI